MQICSMKNIQDIKTILGKHKHQLVLKYGLTFIAIFGSYTQGKQTKDSDIDILVDFDKPIGVEFILLANELEKILNHKVDLVSKKGIKPKYLKSIETDLNYV